MLAGINHIATVTDDLDRLIAFYQEVFDVEEVHRMEERGVRHAFIRIGLDAMLHPFECPPGLKPTEAGLPMFVRGRIDHIALNVDDEETVHRYRRRLHEAGSGDGGTTDFGFGVSVWFRDPDGLECEVVWNRPAASWTDCLDIDDAIRTTAEQWDAKLLKV